MAAEAFLAGRIDFPQIVDTVRKVVDDGSGEWVATPTSVDEVLEADSWARRQARTLLNQKD